MKILLVKTSSLGDIIHSFGALDYLRDRFPTAQIDWVVEAPFAELIKAHPQIDRVLMIDSKKWRKSLFHSETRSQITTFRHALKMTEYDLLFDLQGNLKSSWILAAARSKQKIGFGWKTVPEWPNALFTNNKFNPNKGGNIREDYLALVQSFFQDHQPYFFKTISLKLNPLQQQRLTTLFLNDVRPTLVCPSSAWSNKCLSSEHLMRVLKQLDFSPYWFIWGNAAEREMALHLSSFFDGSTVLERLSLPLLQHVMARSHLVISMDSLPLHLCGTTQTPTLSFFGPSSASKYRPIGKNHYSIQGECPYKIEFEKRCPKLRTCQTGACLKISAQMQGRESAAVLACKELSSG